MAGMGGVGGKAGMLGVLKKQKNPRDFKYIVGVGFFFSFPYVQVFQISQYIYTDDANNDDLLLSQQEIILFRSGTRNV